LGMNSSTLWRARGGAAAVTRTPPSNERRHRT
jgi:hypothetical protein